MTLVWCRGAWWKVPRSASAVLGCHGWGCVPPKCPAPVQGPDQFVMPSLQRVWSKALMQLQHREAAESEAGTSFLTTQIQMADMLPRPRRNASPVPDSVGRHRLGLGTWQCHSCLEGSYMIQTPPLGCQMRHLCLHFQGGMRELLYQPNGTKQTINTPNAAYGMI